MAETAVAEREVRQERLYRDAMFAPETANLKERTIEVVWSTGARVLRRSWWEGTKWWEELSLAPGAVRLERLNSRAPLLDSHMPYSVKDQLGVVERAWIVQNGDGSFEGRALIRFSQNDDVTPVWDNVRAGIVCNVSIGYNVFTWEEVDDETTDIPIRTAVDWEPGEISLVSINADVGAGVRAEQNSQAPNLVPQSNSATIRARHNRAEEQTMPPEVTPTATQPAKATPDTATRAAPVAEVTPAQPAAPATPETRAAPSAPTADPVADERSRASEILTLCRKAQVPESFAAKLIQDAVRIEDARAQIVEEWGKRSGQPTVAHLQVLTDERDKVRSAVERALLHRADPVRFPLENDDSARDYRSMSLLEMGRDMLERQGIQTRRFSKQEQAEMVLGLRSGSGLGAHTSSDFPLITANVANKVLRQTYDAQESTWKPWVRIVEVPDFKDNSRVALGGAPSLEEVKDGGEVKGGKVSEYAEKYKLKNYAKRVVIGRQAIINDDTSAFSRVPQAFAVSAAATESDVVYALLTANAALTDGVALFHATHANLGTLALALAGLTEMRVAMSKQTNPAAQIIHVRPRYVIVPVALQTTAEQLLQLTTAPVTDSNTNPFKGKYMPIAEPRLDASSAVVWYGAADPSAIDTLEVAYLQGQRGPRVETRLGWDVQGIEVMCNLDFGGGPIDFRGMFKSAGTG